MLTQRTRYSMLALGKLAREYGKGPISIQEIAESEKIPKRFLEGILLELKKNAFLGSRMGKNGGYFLQKDPESIQLLEIIRLFEGSIAFLACTSIRCYQPCNHSKDEATCPIRNIFMEIRESIIQKLEATSVADLA